MTVILIRCSTNTVKTPAFNYYTRVDLTVARYNGTSTDTLTYSFVNKSMKDFASGHLYWPLLTGVGDYATLAGDVLPTATISSFSIDNSIGSFGANRKFSDVLQRYTPIEQNVTFYVGESPNDTDLVGTWTTVGTAVCASVEDNPTSDDHILTFNLRTNILKDKLLTLEVNTGVSGMASAPTSSRGRSVPLVISNGDVSFGGPDTTPIRISADGATTGIWAWGTAFSGLMKNRNSIGNPILFTKNYKDDWEYAGGAGFLDFASATSGGTYAINAFPSQAYALYSGNGFGLTYGVQLTAKGNGSGVIVSNAQLTVFLLRYDWVTYQVVEQVAVGRVILRNYDTQNNAGTASFPINVAWDQVAFISSSDSRYAYALGWTCTSYAATDLSLHYVSGFTGNKFVKDSADSSAGQEWKLSSSGANILRATLFSYAETSVESVATSTDTGLTYSTFTLTPSAPDSGQTNPNFDNLPLLVYSSEGITLTGTATTLRYFPDIVKYLDYDWNGSAFVDGGRWDTSRFATQYSALYGTASTHMLRRQPIGAFSSRIMYSDFLNAMCKAMATRVGILSRGKLFLYPWGYPQSAVIDIPPADIIPSSWKILDISTVVNRVNLNLLASPLYETKPFEGGANDGRFQQGYTYASDFSPTTNPSASALTAESRSIWGTKQLADVTEDVIGIDSAPFGAQGGVLAGYYLARFAKPLVYATFTVPFHRYCTLEMFDVITFAHPDFPAYLGTDPDQPLPVYQSGATVQRIDPGAGQELVQAEVYRGLIEGKKVMMPLDHAPAIELTVLVLLNYPKDPT